MGRPAKNNPLSKCITSIRGMSDHLNDGIELLGMVTRRTKAEVIEDAIRVYVLHLRDQGIIRDNTVRTILDDTRLRTPRINSHAVSA